jgi:cystathionine beta-lyase/cystathionine gamma-synthase
MKRKEINYTRVPVSREAGFELYDAETTAKAFRKEADNDRVPEFYIYSRYRNPTVVAAEEEVMKLEGSSWALLTQSGMSAIDTALSIFQNSKKTRPWLFFTEIYGGTLSYADVILAGRRGLDIHSFAPDEGRYNVDKFESIMRSLDPELVYIESISNPMLIVPDVKLIIEIAGKYGSKVIVDNTFATPYLWKPLDSGADLVIHSATKYFSGHGNLTAGVICGNNYEIMKAAIEYRKYTGHMLSADDAYRLHTQIQTFRLRFIQQCINAARTVEIMTSSDKIRKVWYPGLKDHPSHNEAAGLFARKGFGGMVTFDMAGKMDTEKRQHRDQFIKAVSDRIKLVPSLGDPRTILMPVESVWGKKYPEPGMIRLSAGFEETEELITIITKGLKSVT